MREFFQGWRRRVGCITLLMAIALMAGWMRSRLVEDVAACSILDNRHVFATYPDQIVWWTWNESATRDISFPINWSEIDWYLQPPDIIRAYEIKWSAPNLIWHWEVPYWSLTVPLTLLSAWLLLSRPRRSTKPNTGVPPHA